MQYNQSYKWYPVKGGCPTCKKEIVGQPSIAQRFSNRNEHYTTCCYCGEVLGLEIHKVNSITKKTKPTVKGEIMLAKVCKHIKAAELDTSESKTAPAELVEGHNQLRDDYPVKGGCPNCLEPLAGIIPSPNQFTCKDATDLDENIQAINCPYCQTGLNLHIGRFKDGQFIPDMKGTFFNAEIGLVIPMGTKLDTQA